LPSRSRSWPVTEPSFLSDEPGESKCFSRPDGVPDLHLGNERSACSATRRFQLTVSRREPAERLGRPPGYSRAISATISKNSKATSESAIPPVSDTTTCPG